MTQESFSVVGLILIQHNFQDSLDRDILGVGRVWSLSFCQFQSAEDAVMSVPFLKRFCCHIKSSQPRFTFRFSKRRFQIRDFRYFHIQSHLTVSQAFVR